MAPATLVGEGGCIRVDIGIECEERGWRKCAVKVLAGASGLENAIWYDVE
jgi:hypothetical protein